jgi:hypothetical protein
MSPASCLRSNPSIRLARQGLTAQHASPEARAALLPWHMHNLGDIQQPLDSTALFSARLIRDGERQLSQDKPSCGITLPVAATSFAQQEQAGVGSSEARVLS